MSSPCRGTLEELRVATGMSQEQMAAQAGMLRATYSYLERGEKAGLTPRHFSSLAEALGVTEDQIRTAHAASRAAYLRLDVAGSDPDD